MAAESASSMRASFDAIEAATGIDLRQVIQGQATGRGIAQGIAEEQAVAGSATPGRRRAAKAVDADAAQARAEEIGAEFAADA